MDVAVIHVQKASINGTCSIEVDEYHDIDIAIAAKRCIVTCEELVSEEEIRKEPSKNSIPQFCVDAVVHVPFGAHPSQCYNYYDYDANFFKMYDTVTKTEEDLKAFLQEWVYDIKNNDEYIDKLGASRLTKLRVVPGFGYAAKLVKEAK